MSDVKQFIYCPRVVYFTYALPWRRPTTYKMEEGKLQHEHMEEIEERRSLRAYSLIEGEREFNVSLYSKRLGLSGKLDMVIFSRGEIIPVDFKNTGGNVGLNHRYQLTAYALLVEDRWGKPVRRGFIYLVPSKKAHEVFFTPDMRLYVRGILEAIRQMIEKESIPNATNQKGRCRDCEFQNFCNEV